MISKQDRAVRSGSNCRVILSLMLTCNATFDDTLVNAMFSKLRFPKARCTFAELQVFLPDTWCQGFARWCC